MERLSCAAPGAETARVESALPASKGSTSTQTKQSAKNAGRTVRVAVSVIEMSVIAALQALTSRAASAVCPATRNASIVRDLPITV
jgi:hypothetical protein